jgi:hypothetical protein
MEEISIYKTDISNWGEDGNLNLRGVEIYNNSYSFEEILSIAQQKKAPIIIKTSYISKKRPGAWYIKGTREKYISYEQIKEKCEENHKNGLWKVRDCYLIKYSI